MVSKSSGPSPVSHTPSSPPPPPAPCLQGHLLILQFTGGLGHCAHKLIQVSPPPPPPPPRPELTSLTLGFLGHLVTIVSFQVLGNPRDWGGRREDVSSGARKAGS